MVLIFRRCVTIHKFIKWVSVPLRGLWFLSFRIFFLHAMEQQVKFPSPCGDYGSYRVVPKYQGVVNQLSFRPLAGIMVLIGDTWDEKEDISVEIVSVPLRGLWFLSAPFINAFMKPSKWHFAGRIIYFHHFLSFAGKWFSKNCLELNFKAAGRNRPACIFKKQVRHINNVLPSQFIL